MNKKTKKRQYRIRNWPQYNAALKKRGALTVWVDAEALQGWCNPQKTGRRGASCHYSDSAILCALTVQCVYHLPLRATQGLLASIFALMHLDLPVPDASTLSRRRQKLEISLLESLPSGPLHLIVDASGFKVFGEGEWKVRQHGWSQRRTWRKLHIGIKGNEVLRNEVLRNEVLRDEVLRDEVLKGEILTAVASTNSFRDDDLLGSLLAPLAETELEQVCGDGIYDSRRCYQLLEKRGVRATIPPRRNARLADLEARPELAQRNAHIQRIAALGRRGQVGRKRWKEEVGYHRRSLVETTFFRLKTIFGQGLSARSFAGQAGELLLRCAVLNHMTHLGMPQCYPL